MTEVARLFVGVYADTSKLASGLREAEGQVTTADSRMAKASSAMGMATKAAFAGAAVAAVKFGKDAFDSAVQFESAMANVQAVTGQTDAQIAALSQQVLAVGAGSVPGVQATATAFYDISSAVTDASARMDTLRASVALAEAGQADLAVTSDGLISAMNAYSLGADQATYASDVFARTVATGKGTMDQFVSAMAPVLTLTQTAGINFDEVGASIAFMTSKGASASKASTELQGIITALLKPTKELEQAYADLGITNIRTTIEQQGFLETLQQITAEAGGSQSQLAAMFGRVEALQGALALGTTDANSFFDAYNTGLEGATSRAREAQLDTFSAQWAMLKSNVDGASVAMVNQGGILGGLTDALQGVNSVFDFLQQGGAQMPEAQTAADLGFTATISYVTQEGDTVASVAEALNISVEEARAMLEGMDALEFHAGIKTLDLADLEAALGGIDLDTALQNAGIEITLPATVSDEQVTAYLQEHGSATAQQARDILQSQMDTEFAAKGIHLPANFDTGDLATIISQQTGMAYDDAMMLAQQYINQSPGTLTVRPGVNTTAVDMELRRFEAEINASLSRIRSQNKASYDAMVGDASAFEQLLSGILAQTGIDISPRQIDEATSAVTEKTGFDFANPLSYSPENILKSGGAGLANLLSGGSGGESSVTGSHGGAQGVTNPFFTASNMLGQQPVQFGPDPDSETLLQETISNIFDEEHNIKITDSYKLPIAQMKGALDAATQPRPVSIPLYVYLAGGAGAAALDAENAALKEATSTYGPTTGTGSHGGARAGGGDVKPGMSYTVGEQGPETLVMGSQGGHVYPNGSAQVIENHIHLMVSGQELAQIVNRVNTQNRQ